MSVHKLDDGRNIVRFRKGTIPDDPDRTCYYFERGLLGEVAAERKNAEIFRAKKKRTAGGPRFGDLADEYLESRKPDMAETTFAATHYSIEAHIEPFFGSLSVYDLDAALLDKYVRERKKPQRKNGKKREDGTFEIRIVNIKNVTIGRELSIVKAIMSWSFDRGLIGGNKIAGYKLPKRDDLIQPPPTPNEIAAILENAAPHLKRAILIAFYTGLRPGRSELLSLKWSAVNFCDNVIFIESAKKGGVIARVVPINKLFLKLLREWHQEDKTLEKIPKTIVHYKGKTIGTLKTAWRTAKKDAGIERKLKLYSLRHAATHSLLSAGNDPRTVAGITGNTLEMLLGPYFQSSNELRRKAVEDLPDVTKKPLVHHGTSKIVNFKK